MSAGASLSVNLFIFQFSVNLMYQSELLSLLFDLDLGRPYPDKHLPSVG